MNIDKNGVIIPVNRICETCPRHVENHDFYWCCECFNKQSPHCYERGNDGRWRYGSTGDIVK